jgi:hypothetical protein
MDNRDMPALLAASQILGNLARGQVPPTRNSGLSWVNPI